MRSWYPISPRKLDNKRLLAEHNELLIMAKAIVGINKGFRRHPETLRWIGRTKAMKIRHDVIAREMLQRGMNHNSPWPKECVLEQDISEMPVKLWDDMYKKFERKGLGPMAYGLVKGN